MGRLTGHCIRLGSAGMGIALAAAVTTASAQTVISREITTEPVETIVTQGPDGTVVSRRPLGTQGIGTETVYSAPSSRVVETVETVERPVTVQRRTSNSARDTRTERKPTQSRGTVSVRTTTRTTTQAAAPLSLTPDDRRMVYRNVVRERVAPQTAPEVVTAPAPRLAYQAPVRVVGENNTPVVEAVDTYVGSRLPENVAYYEVPESLAMQLPMTRSYHYAYLDGRVLLVDPRTGVVVADITER